MGMDGGWTGSRAEGADEVLPLRRRLRRPAVACAVRGIQRWSVASSPAAPCNLTRISQAVLMALPQG